MVPPRRLPTHNPDAETTPNTVATPTSVPTTLSPSSPSPAVTTVEAVVVVVAGIVSTVAMIVVVVRSVAAGMEGGEYMVAVADGGGAAATVVVVVVAVATVVVVGAGRPVVVVEDSVVVVVGAVVVVVVGPGAGGGSEGGCAVPVENDHPSTVPGDGTRSVAPWTLAVHEPPRSACQYDQWASAGGVSTHGLSGSPSMRQTNPGWFWTMITWNPASCRAASPDDGEPEAQPTWGPPPSDEKSTTTVTPSASGHSAAHAGDGPAHSSEATRPSQTSDSGPGRRERSALPLIWTRYGIRFGSQITDLVPDTGTPPSGPG